MRQSSLLVIFLIVFIDLVGFGIIIPIIPYYAQAYGANGWKLGWLLASYSLMQFLFTPLWETISDYVGRRPVLLISLLGSAASMAVLGIAGSLQWLFIGRILAGFSGSGLSTAHSYIADVTSEKDRMQGVGMMGAAVGLGFVFGPALGGVLSRYGFAVPMYAGALMILCNFVFAFFKLEEPRISVEKRVANRSRRLTAGSIRSTLSDPRSQLALLLFFLLIVGMSQLEAVFAIYTGAVHQFDAETTGVMFALMGTVIVVVQAGVLDRLTRRFSPIKLAAFSLLISGIALFFLASLQELHFVILSLCLLAAGYAVAQPSVSTLATFGETPQKQGAVMGVFQAAGSFARIVGPPTAGWLFDRISWRSPFYAAAIIMTFGAVIALAGIRRKLDYAASTLPSS